MSAPQRPTAHSYEAGGRKEVASGAHMQDKCFLCPEEVKEADPRQFYTAPNGGLMLAHTRCLNRFYANGEKWPPQEEMPAQKPDVSSLAGLKVLRYGNARLLYDGRQLHLLCNQEITEHGLKAVIPDLIVALQAVQEAL